MSHTLGLHKDSFNYLSSSSRTKSLSKIQKFYTSIEPVEEENEEPEMQITKHKKGMSVFQDAQKNYVSNHMKSTGGNQLNENQKRIRRQILRHKMYDELIETQVQQD